MWLSVLSLKSSPFQKNLVWCRSPVLGLDVWQSAHWPLPPCSTLGEGLALKETQLLIGNQTWDTDESCAQTGLVVC